MIMPASFCDFPRASFRACVFGAVLLTSAAAAPAMAQEPERVWNFRVYLNDAAIGTHRFTLRSAGAERELLSEARFEVKVLGLTVYRYAHRAVENWRGDCLTKLTASTNDDGEKLAVDAAVEGDRLRVNATGFKESLGGCVMSFAYWNPLMLRQSRLLNAQTGQYEQVGISLAGEEGVLVGGKPVTAKRYRISGLKNPLDLYYSGSGEWLGLESTVGGGRRLRYQLAAPG